MKGLIVYQTKRFLIQVFVDMEAMQDHAKAWTTRVRRVELYHSRARLQRQRPHKARCPDSEFILIQMLAILDCRQWVTKAKVPIAASRA